MSSLAIPVVANGFSHSFLKGPLFDGPGSTEDRVLVLIRLNGGNDGLNTVIPLDAYANLYRHRPNVIIPEKALINITETNAFHPSFKELATLYKQDKLSVIQNVGYPEQNRSHFRSMDIWSRGNMDPTVSTGWMGRYFDNNYKNFPSEYPNKNHPFPFAISMGYEVSSTCQGHSGNFSHTISDLELHKQLKNVKLKSGKSIVGQNLDHVNTIVRQTNNYEKVIYQSAQAGHSDKSLYNQKNVLAMSLSDVAKMISGGCKTKVYVLNLGGFDTHGGQLSNIDPTKGVQAELLQTVSEAIYSFQLDLEAQKLDHRVLGLTFSEFGRQIMSNENNGTDHGDAGPMFLFGSQVNNGVHGDNPVIGKEVPDQAGIQHKVDFRNVYASVLKDWFEVSKSEIEPLFANNIKYYNVLK